MAIQQKGLWWRVSPFQASPGDFYFKDKHWAWEVWNGPDLLEWGYTQDKDDSVRLACYYFKDLSSVLGS